MHDMELARNRIRPFVDRGRQFSGWRLDEFDPKPLEPPPPWDYETRAVELIRAANSVLDMGTGGGELFDALTASFFGRTVATEPWSVNAPIAAARLRPRGIAVVRCGSLQLPFRPASFDLVLNRHEELDPAEVARVITFDGSVLTQQVGSSRWRELRPFFPRMQDFGDLFHRYEHGLETSGLTIVQARTHDWKAAYRTLGDIVFLLCIAPWEIPHFDPLDADLPALLAAEESLSTEQGIVLTESRFLIEARRTWEDDFDPVKEYRMAHGDVKSIVDSPWTSMGTSDTA